MNMLDEDWAYEATRQERVDSACWGHEANISISATGQALIAMEAEIKALADEEERLIIKRRLVQQKMQVCYDAIRKLMLNTGVQIPPLITKRYPELHMED